MYFSLQLGSVEFSWNRGGSLILEMEPGWGSRASGGCGPDVEDFGEIETKATRFKFDGNTC